MSLSAEDIVLIRAQARVLLSLTAITWIIHFINWGLFRGWLIWAFALRPRNLWGLVGIFTFPFLHLSNRHLTGNTGAFLLLGWFVLLQGIHLFYVVTIGIALLGGLGTWLMARPNGVVGASGVIYGYMGFLLIYGITAGSALAMILALIWLYRDGWRITGDKYNASQILPGGNPRMSWEGHFCGFIAGALVAFLLSEWRFN
ncbi:MAG: rhomboid family intramembrane serine protease [Cyanobacteria bacterium CRU_2_1]|nr:rhomboid family intramembrane serine protease [Cyanobacteria bacterium RU_5_0]NJR57968.1 rhomboid family intramembrane serine protease [Cyanobacteria bacterium CRU_2_1]